MEAMGLKALEAMEALKILETLGALEPQAILGNLVALGVWEARDP